MKHLSKDCIAVIIFSFFCLFLYYNSLWGIFIFDDAHSIVTNIYIKDSRYIPMFFKGFYTSDTEVPIGMFRPLLLLTFSFNYFFSGIQPLGYHIINVLLHFLNGILFYYLLRQLFVTRANLPNEENSQESLPFIFSVCYLFFCRCTFFYLYSRCNDSAIRSQSHQETQKTFVILCVFESWW